MTSISVPLLNEKEAAKVLDVSPGTLSVWQCTGRYGIPFVKIGRCVRYRIGDLQAWLETRLHSTGNTSLPASPATPAPRTRKADSTAPTKPGNVVLGQRRLASAP